MRFDYQLFSIKGKERVMIPPKNILYAELFEIFKDSPLRGIIEALLKEDFAPAEESPPKEGDIPIGQLGLLEKAIYTAQVNNKIKFKKLMERLDIHPSAGITEYEMEEIKKELDETISEQLILHFLVEASNRRHLRDKGVSTNKRIKLREDYQIVIPGEPPSGEEVTLATLAGLLLNR